MIKAHYIIRLAGCHESKAATRTILQRPHRANNLNDERICLWLDQIFVNQKDLDGHLGLDQ
jgi:hypothetical protein